MKAVLRRHAAQGGLDIATDRTSQCINTDWRLGNTGAAAVFVQMALDVMGRHIEGGVSAAVDLRDPAGAGIVFIGPPTDAMRKAQDGRAFFEHRVQPAIDPADYR